MKELTVYDYKKVQCVRCKKMKYSYSAKNYCQKCYREMLEEYSYYDYGVDKTRINGTALKVCEMLIEEGVDRKEIHKILGIHKVYVNQILNKYVIRVNAYGEKRPF